MEKEKLKFSIFFWRVTTTHVITYFIMGLIASILLNYKDAFEKPPMSYFMRSVDSPWVAIGPVLQVIRGLIFTIVLWFFKEKFLFEKYGWLKLWGLIVGLSILSTTGPAPGSIEGMIYTKIPLVDQFKGYFEVIPQTLFFSLFLNYWYIKPKKAWNIISVSLMIIIVLLCMMGLIASK
jgi:membrane protein CcdC involved in cytochrome C biogenesis